MTVDLFHIDYSRLTEVLITIVVLAFLLERALSVLFEHRWFIQWSEGKFSGGKPRKGLKEMIATAVCIGFCYWQNFDAVSILLQSSEKPTFWGVVISGLIIAGGSKASIALFRDALGFMSTAEKERKEINKVKREVVSDVEKRRLVEDALQSFKK